MRETGTLAHNRRHPQINSIAQIRSEAIGAVPEDADSKVLSETALDAVDGVFETTVAM